MGNVIRWHHTLKGERRWSSCFCIVWSIVCLVVKELTFILASCVALFISVIVCVLIVKTHFFRASEELRSKYISYAFRSLKTSLLCLTIFRNKRRIHAKKGFVLNHWIYMFCEISSIPLAGAHSATMNSLLRIYKPISHVFELTSLVVHLPSHRCVTLLSPR